jgi:hypothetical protein
MGDDLRRRAEEAARILSSPLFNEAYALLDKKTVSAWRAARSPEERERLHMRQDILADLWMELCRHIEMAANRENEADGFFRTILKQLKR